MAKRKVGKESRRLVTIAIKTKGDVYLDITCVQANMWQKTSKNILEFTASEEWRPRQDSR